VEKSTKKVKWTRGFETAKAASEYAVAPRHSRKVGAALFSGSSLLSIGANRYGHSHPQAKWGIHAEHAALIKRRHHPNNGNLILYVYRELSDGSPALCKPCANCQNLMSEVGVRLVRFVDSAGDFAQLVLK
jgi:cytidine deaminase